MGVRELCFKDKPVALQTDENFQGRGRLDFRVFERLFGGIHGKRPRACVSVFWLWRSSP